MAGKLPQFQSSEDADLLLAAPDDSSSTEVVVPSELSFAEEVRGERLDVLWKATMVAVFGLLWSLVVINGGDNLKAFDLLIPGFFVAVGCLSTRWYLRRERFSQAVWSYALGAILGITIMMAFGGEVGEEYLPFVLPLLIFVVGLLVPARTTVVMLVLATLGAIGFPSLWDGTFVLGPHTIFALVLTTMATALSAQVSGELFAIAEWALESYRKERQTTFALFESREALQKSLLRQQALTKQVQDANEQLEIARQAAEEAKHFRGQFLANMSHELRTPLNAIIGFSQTMLDFPAMYDDVNLPVQYRQDMNQILSSGKHLLAIINDILDLSKVDAGKLDLEIQPVDLAPIVKGVLSTAVGLVGEKGEQVKLRQELADPLPNVLGDPLRVRQVLLNLYSNAAKFTDAGYIKLKVWTEGSEVIFAVEDTGIGISESDKRSIFEEFRQGTAGRKKGRQGAGLGLAISQQLVRLMNGRLWFESEVGRGSSFFIALPLYVPEPEGGVEPVAEPIPATRTRKPRPRIKSKREVTPAEAEPQSADVASSVSVDAAVDVAADVPK